MEIVATTPNSCNGVPMQVVQVPMSQVFSGSLITIPNSSTSPTVVLVPVNGTTQSQQSNTTYVLNTLPTASTSSQPISDKNSNPFQQQLANQRQVLQQKLQMRPPRSHLIEQGIIPTSAAHSASFHEKKLKLQRAQMGDVLKRKIEQRPDKQHLFSQHILLADSTADPLIQEKQRQLKKCKLADNLNDKLAHRPGPLELVQENILHVDEQLEQAVKEGLLNFKPTSAGMALKHPQQSMFYVDDFDSNSRQSSVDESTALVLGPLDVSGTVVSSQSSYTPGVSPVYQTGQQQSFSNKPKVKAKKLKTSRSSTPYSTPNISQDCQQQRKIIKFHEYKGPPIQKPLPPNPKQMKKEWPSPEWIGAFGGDNSDNLTKDDESSYDLLLQQQQLFLQWQLELHQKYPNSNIQLMMPHVNTESNASTSPEQSPLAEEPQTPNQSASNYSFIGQNICPEHGEFEQPITCEHHQSTNENPSEEGTVKCRPVVSKLADLRVSDLKAECKKRNLPVSGPKPSLLERLKPYENNIVQKDPNTEIHSPVVEKSIPAQNVIQEYLQQPSGFNGMNQPPPTPNSSDFSCSDTSGVASNYSSPGIEFGQMSFGSVPNAGCFSFAGQGSGGQFTLGNGQMNVNQKHGSMECENTMQIDTPQMRQNDRTQQNDNGPTKLDFDGLVSATTLSIHEQMLRHQQRKIEELQRELQRSQEQLRHQQQVILAARKSQSNEKNGNDSSKSSNHSAAENWLSQIDTKHLQKFHIQLFLQYKLQQQQLQQQMQLQHELTTTQQQLKEEFGVQQAVSEVVRLLKQDPRTAILMLQLLRRFNNEKSRSAQSSNTQNATNTSANVEQPEVAKQTTKTTSSACCKQQNTKTTPVECCCCHQSQKKNSDSATPKPVNTNTKAKSSKKPSTKSVPSSPSKAKPSSSGLTTNMEEIFKTVLDYANKATEKTVSNNNDDKNNNGDSTDNRLPSCDKLIPPYRNPMSECESVQTVVESVQPPSASLDHFGTCLPSVTTTDAQQFLTPKTNHQVLDDLIDVLKGQESVCGDQLFNQHGYPNTYGAQELTDLLGSDWLQDTPNVHNLFPIQSQNGLHYQQVQMSQNSEPMTGVQSISDMGVSSAQIQTPLDLGIFSQSCNDQNMDWLDLILPSPTDQHLPLANNSSDLLAQSHSLGFGPTTSNPVLGQTTNTQINSAFDMSVC